MADQDASDPLRRQVSFLGKVLGDTLSEQEGPSIFELEERFRALAKARRAAPGDASRDAAMKEAIAELDVATAEKVARAFAHYFQLTNLSEQYHRVRRRREHAREGTGQRNDLTDRFQRIAENVDRATFEAALARASVELVFTAHPTQAQRATVLAKHRSITDLLARLEETSLTPRERQKAEQRIREEVALLWQTDEIRQVKPRPGDEVKNVLFYLEEILYPLIPSFYESVEDALAQAYGSRIEVPTFLRFGQWVGADMDGNPNVTPAVAIDTAFALATRVTALHLDQLDELGFELSQSQRRVSVSDELLASIEEDHRAIPELAKEADPRTHEEPYRRKLRWMEERLRATREAFVRGRGGAPTDVGHGYRDASELLADLRVIERSLAGNKGAHAGLSRVRALRRQVEVFGFHFARLDVRVGALWVREAVAQALWLPAGTLADEKALHSALTDPRIPSRPDAPGMGAMEALAAMRKRIVEQSGETFILSMAHGRDDMLATLVLARIAGLYRPDEGKAGLSVTPLFETLADLQRAAAEIDAALSDPVYRRYLALRGDVQEVMVGYSDSSKDAGIIASSFALYEAQRALIAVGEKHGVTIKVFHGRGGSIGRGGGPSRRAIESLPPGLLRGGFKLTEQGEVIGWKYLLPELAERNLGETGGGVLAASLATSYPDDAQIATYQSAFKEAAEIALRTYRDLVRSDDFIAYYTTSTPLAEIGALPLGSRPARRTGAASIDDLRAIPWTFAWMQSRQNVPGWFGAGEALSHLVATRGVEFVRQMKARWPFFSTTLDAIAVGLAVADMGIAAHYASLVPDRAIAERMFGKIRNDHARAVAAVMEIEATDSLLAKQPVLARSIELRNPYVDPMSFIQLDLLRRKRELLAAGQPVPETLERAILLTINGIAAGLRNTG